MLCFKIENLAAGKLQNLIYWLENESGVYIQTQFLTLKLKFQNPLSLQKWVRQRRQALRGRQPCSGLHRIECQRTTWAEVKAKEGEDGGEGQERRP